MQACKHHCDGAECYSVTVTLTPTVHSADFTNARLAGPYAYG